MGILDVFRKKEPRYIDLTPKAGKLAEKKTEKLPERQAKAAIKPKPQRVALTCAKCNYQFSSMLQHKVIDCPWCGSVLDKPKN